MTTVHDDVWALIIKALRIRSKKPQQDMRASLQEAEDEHWINAMYLDAFGRFRPHVAS